MQDLQRADVSEACSRQYYAYNANDGNAKKQVTEKERSPEQSCV
jgi:hypothetical protein